MVCRCTCTILGKIKYFWFYVVDQYLKLSDSPLVKYGGRNQEYALHILLRCQGNIWVCYNQYYV